MSNWTPFLLLWLIGALLMFTLQQTTAERKLENQKLSGLFKWKYEKRPFCNAFTGCGKKRTPIQSGQTHLMEPLSLPPQSYSLLKRAEVTDVDANDFSSDPNNNNNNRNYYTNNNDNMNLIGNDDLNEGLSDLIDINAEPAVENVQQQIMSQAKIFEAIREASREIFRQRNKQKQLQNQLLAHEEQQNGHQQLLTKSIESEP